MFQRYKRRSYELAGVALGGVVLDIGCGLGQDVAALADLVGPTGRVVGIDHDPEMVRLAKDAVTAQNARIEIASASALPFNDGEFTAARIDRVLMHIAGGEAVISETRRVLGSGAVAVAVEPDWGTYVLDVPDVALARRVLDARADAFADGFVGRRLYRMFRDAGFVDIRVEPFVVLNTEYDAASRGVDLAHAAQFGIRAGTVTSDEASRWAEMTAQVAAATTFLSAVTLFMVAGRRP